MPVFQLTEELIFPHPSYANEDGLLAVGGDLRPERLLQAYVNGIFPWYEEGGPILWWSPDPRLVLFPDRVKVSKSMRQVLNKKQFRVTFDREFNAVIEACGEVPREGQDGTWITSEMIEAYVHLHQLGFAHSVEVWRNDQLVGGLYGVCVGDAFFGESMFARESNASKTGFIHLVRWLEQQGIRCIDCQIRTDHLVSLGAEEISREQFLEMIRLDERKPHLETQWSYAQDQPITRSVS